MSEHVAEPRAYRSIRQLGVVSWSAIGFIVLLGIVTGGLAAVSELALPLVFAVMVGAAAYPLARRLHRCMKPSLAAMAVVLGSLASAALLAVFVVKGVVQQTGELAHQIDLAVANMADTADGIGLDAAALTALRGAIAGMAGFVGRGLVTVVVGGVSAITGFVAGTVLAILIGYYVLKDGPVIERWLVRQFPESGQSDVDDFLRTGVRSIRAYWAGRSVLSAAVTVVIVGVSLIMGLPLIGTIAIVNFIGGYVPYLGAFLGGGLATVLAVADGGVSQGFVMLAVVLSCNLLLENVLEPMIMSDKLSIHPLVVLLATTFGGIVGGMVGLILAVPVAVLVIDLVRRLRSAGVSARIPQQVRSLQDRVLPD
jgi:predicted PurR-regulated permease PerM